MITFATPTVATPTVATPTVATPTVATPTVATPTVATPTVATPTVATPAAPSLPLIVESALLGTVRADANAVYAFPDGIYGFERARSFVLVPAGREGLCWLQSTEDGGLVLLLADPHQFFGSDVPVGDTPGEVVQVVVTLPQQAGALATANLQAPLLFDAVRSIGRQTVCDDGRQRVRIPIDLG